MRTIVLNQSNIVAGTNNTTLVYNFPNSVDLTGCEIAVSNINMYYSWDNININFGNNTFTYDWTTGVTTVTYTVTIPNGIWNISDINAYLQFTFIANGHYLVNAGGQNVYYAEFLVNPNRYAIQVNTFPVPTALPALWTNPAGLVFPTTTFNPTLTFPAKFNEIVGYAAGFATVPNTGVGTTLSYLSSVAPQVQPNSNLLINLTNIDNKYANPSSVIYSIAPSVGIGELIIEKPPELNFNKLLAGTYNQLRLTFTAPGFTPVYIRDPNMTIIMCIRDAPVGEDIGAQSLTQFKLAGGRIRN